MPEVYEGAYMSPRMLRYWLSIIAVSLLFSIAAHAQDGAAVFRQRCAVCHEAASADNRAPNRIILQQMSATSIVRTLETGAMREVVGSLTPAERDAVAKFLTGKSREEEAAAAAAHPQVGLCSAAPKSFSVDPAAPQWNGWSIDPGNRRFQSTQGAGLSAATVPSLKLKWAFGFEGDSLTFSQPTIIGGSIFVGSQQGKIYSLNAATGCIQWSFQADASVRNALTIVPLEKGPAKFAAYFGDQRGSIYALDAATGRLLWKIPADPHPQTRITGSPVFWRGHLYVPVSSAEEVASIDPHYECCRFRGSVLTLDAATGKQVWKTYLAEETPHPTQKTSNGTQFWGPSGMAIWSAPTLDPEHNVLYVGTGNNYSAPPTPTSDAIVALQLDNGKVALVPPAHAARHLQQFLPHHF